jgi:hypothetical protein
MMDHGKNFMFGVSTVTHFIMERKHRWNMLLLSAGKKNPSDMQQWMWISIMCVKCFDGLAQINMDTIPLVGGSMCQVDAFPLKYKAAHRKEK